MAAPAKTRFFVEYVHPRTGKDVHTILKGCSSIVEAHEQARRMGVEIVEIKESHDGKLPEDIVNRRNRARNIAVLAIVVIALVVAIAVMFRSGGYAERAICRRKTGWTACGPRGFPYR